MVQLGFRGYATAWLACAMVLSAACSDGTRRPRSDGGADAGDGDVPSSCSDGVEYVCRGNLAQKCASDGTVESETNCGETDEVCVPDLGCAPCHPGRTSCDGNDVRRCRDDASGYEVIETCDPSTGRTCNASVGACTNPCEDAVAENSYIGCEYYPTVTTNSELAAEFEFAVVVANPQDSSAEVTVTRGGSTEATVTVPGGGLEAIKLPWVDALKNEFMNESSALVRDGAYKLTSTLPVTVYQLNPLDYRIDMDCEMEPGGFPIPDGQCFSFSNDASLVLPAHVLTGNYIAASRPSLKIMQGTSTLDHHGFVTVIGVDTAPVDVEVRLTANTLASADGAVGAMSPGGTGTWTLNQGDVLQILADVPSGCPDSVSDGTQTFCNVGPDYDLTGTEIRASGKVAVISGHECAFVPFDKFACDHLEEQMFPLEAWGKDFIVAATEPLRPEGEPNVVRIVSGKDGNDIAFEPSVSSDVTLGRGEMLEFETTEDFRVTGSEALMVTQFLVGQNYFGMTEMEAEGDPSMSLAIPTEQFRTEYTFLAPASFETHFVNVIGADGQVVSLDGTEVSGWRSVGSTGNATARVSISSGAHTITSPEPFGIVVYGFGSFTSYMYPGGLDFEQINVPF